jgi:hypothetical protein
MAGQKEQSMRSRSRQLLAMLMTFTAAASAVSGCAGGRPGGSGTSQAARAERDAAVADPAHAIVGGWRGTAPCDGAITFRPDRTYERRHYSPGDYRVAGAWSLRQDTSPPTLTLTCEQSDNRDDVGRVEDMTLVRLDANELVYQIGETLSRYERDVTAAPCCASNVNPPRHGLIKDSRPLCFSHVQRHPRTPPAPHRR